MINFFFNDTATTEIYTLSLHDALPIFHHHVGGLAADARERLQFRVRLRQDRKSTRLNSSHQIISYAVFCLKKKKSNQPSTVGKQEETQARTEYVHDATASHGYHNVPHT